MKLFEKIKLYISAVKENVQYIELKKLDFNTNIIVIFKKQHKNTAVLYKLFYDRILNKEKDDYFNIYEYILLHISGFTDEYIKRSYIGNYITKIIRFLKKNTKNNGR
jgi:hypothetical protein